MTTGRKLNQYKIVRNNRPDEHQEYLPPLTLKFKRKQG